METNLKPLFEPRSVAVIGASTHPEKIGYKVLYNIKAGGYRGKVYPVNPRGGKLLDFDVYKKVRDIDESIDLGIIVFLHL